MQKLKKAQNKMNAFSVFTSEYLRDYRDKNGHTYVGGFSAAMNDPDLKSRWDSLSLEEKEEYKEKAREEKGRSRTAYAAGLAAMPPSMNNSTDTTTESGDWDVGNDGFGATARNQYMSFEEDARKNDHRQRVSESRSSSRASQNSLEHEALTAANPVRLVGSGSISNGQAAQNVFGSSSQFGQVRVPLQGSQNKTMAASVISKVQPIVEADGDYETAGLENPDDDEEAEDLMGDVEEPTAEEKETEPTPVATIVPPMISAPNTAQAPIETVATDNIPYDGVDEDIQIEEVIPAAPADVMAPTIPTPEIQQPVAAAPYCPVPDIQQPVVITPVATMPKIQKPAVVAPMPKIQQPMVVAPLPEIQQPVVVAPMPQIQQPMVVAPLPKIQQRVVVAPMPQVQQPLTDAPMSEIQQVAVAPTAPMPQIHQPEAGNANMNSMAPNTIGWTHAFRDDYFAQLRMPYGCRGLGRGQHFLPQMAALDNLMREFLSNK